MSFSLPNGTYCYTIYAVPGYTITAGTASGSLTVSGASPPGIAVTFTPKT